MRTARNIRAQHLGDGSGSITGFYPSLLAGRGGQSRKWTGPGTTNYTKCGRFGATKVSTQQVSRVLLLSSASFRVFSVFRGLISAVLWSLSPSVPGPLGP